MLSRLVLFLFLVGIAAGCGFSLRDSVPMFKPVGLEDEIKISRDFRREANANFHLIRQPEVLDYVNHIGRRILSTMGPQPYEYRFFIVENPQLNAFAVPGGSIYINSGLIEAVRSTDELASVMAHEIIHVKSRHMARMSGPDPVSLLGLLGAVLAATGSQGAAAASLGPAIAATRQLSYTRALEQEADNLGVKYMNEAGYDPSGSLTFFKHLDEERAMNPIRVPPYLLTHPLTADRIGSAEVMIRSLGPRPAQSRQADSIRRVQFFLHLQLPNGQNRQAAPNGNSKGANESNNAEALHLRALEYAETGEWEKARETYERVRTLDPHSPGLDRDLGRLYTQTGDFRRGHEAFARAIKSEPRESLNYFYLGELYEKEAQWSEAAGAYLMAHELFPFWPEPARQLGDVYQKMDRLGDSYYYLGRAHLLMDEDEKAMADLERAVAQYDTTSLRRQVIRDEIDAIRAQN